MFSGCLNYCIFRNVQLSVHQPVPKTLAFGSHCSANFQLILNCFIPNLELKYEDSENIKADRVTTVVFNLHQVKCREISFGNSVVVLLW